MLQFFKIKKKYSNLIIFVPPPVKQITLTVTQTGFRWVKRPPMASLVDPSYHHWAAMTPELSFTSVGHFFHVTSNTNLLGHTVSCYSRLPSIRVTVTLLTYSSQHYQTFSVSNYIQRDQRTLTELGLACRTCRAFYPQQGSDNNPSSRQFLLNNSFLLSNFQLQLSPRKYLKHRQKNIFFPPYLDECVGRRRRVLFQMT